MKNLVKSRILRKLSDYLSNLPRRPLQSRIKREERLNSTPPPPQPTSVQSSGHHHEQGDEQVSPADNPDHDEKVLTAEEIAKLYEEEEDDPDNE